MDNDTNISLNLDSSNWSIALRLQIISEAPFMGPGSAELLRLLEQSNSVRAASLSMGLSYSKAWKIINTLEDATGLQVIIRQKGGSGGGLSYLTEDGKALLRWYDTLEEKCKLSINEIFEQTPFRR